LLVGYVEMLGKVRLRFACGNTGKADRASQIAIEMMFGIAFATFNHGTTAALTQSQLVGWYPRQRYLAGYVQDTWKATPHLTVIAGLRWEPYLSPYTKYIQSGVFSNQWYVEGLHSTVFPNAPVGVLFSGDPGVSLGEIKLR
jgi:outer membrane receptor protein involved in Fe transport